MKKVLVLFLSCIVLITMFANTVCAAETYETLYEEGFEDYEENYDAASTTLKDMFVIEANSIGEGYVKVREAEDGHLFLENHVFTQCYLKEALTTNYVFSCDVIKMDGFRAASIFFRSPAADCAYYEHDGDATLDRAHNKTGINVFVYSTQFSICIKSYDGKTISQYFNFDHDQIDDAQKLTVKDLGTKMEFYLDDTLMCSIVFGEGGARYGAIGVTEKCFKTLEIFDADGESLGVVNKPVVSSQNSVVGWATRVGNLDLDNVKIEVAKVEEETTIEETVTELETTAEETTTVAETILDETTVADTTVANSSMTEVETEAATENTKTGCGGVIASSSCAMMVLIGLCGYALKKKY